MLDNLRHIDDGTVWTFSEEARLVYGEFYDRIENTTYENTAINTQLNTILNMSRDHVIRVCGGLSALEQSLTNMAEGEGVLHADE